MELKVIYSWALSMALVTPILLMAYIAGHANHQTKIGLWFIKKRWAKPYEIPIQIKIKNIKVKNAYNEIQNLSVDEKKLIIAILEELSF